MLVSPVYSRSLLVVEWKIRSVSVISRCWEFSVDRTLEPGMYVSGNLHSKLTRDMCRLLGDFHFFTRFYHLSELNSRDDLINGMIAHFDYSR